MSNLYRPANKDVDMDTLVSDGLVVRNRIDYEAALRLHHESVRPLISGAQCDREMRAVKMLVDAALGIEEDS